MSRSRWLASGAMLCCAAIAQAHTHTEMSMPAEGSTVQAPRQLMFMFSEATRFTALTIQKEGEAEQKIAPLSTTASAHVMVAAPALSNGRYTVTWRAMGTDDHVVSGTLHFTVSDKAPAMGMGMGAKPGTATAPKPAAPTDEHAGHKH